MVPYSGDMEQVWVGHLLGATTLCPLPRCPPDASVSTRTVGPIAHRQPPKPAVQESMLQEHLNDSQFSHCQEVCAQAKQGEAPLGTSLAQRSWDLGTKHSFL